DRRSPLLRLCHVQAQIMCVVAELSCDSMAFVVENVADYDLGPFAEQEARVFGAHAAGAARDQRDFSFDSSHENLPLPDGGRPVTAMMGEARRAACSR